MALDMGVTAFMPPLEINQISPDYTGHQTEVESRRYGMMLSAEGREDEDIQMD